MTRFLMPEDIVKDELRVLWRLWFTTEGEVGKPHRWRRLTGPADWREEYNTYRLHSALGVLTPAEFAARWRTNKLLQLT